MRELSQCVTRSREKSIGVGRRTDTDASKSQVVPVTVATCCVQASDFGTELKKRTPFSDMESCVLPRFELSAFVYSTPAEEAYVLLNIPQFKMAMARQEAYNVINSESNGEFVQLWGAPAGEDAYGVIVSWAILSNTYN